MDLSFITAANSALSAAREICKAAIGIRDFNQLATTVAQLNEQILKAQDSLFTLQTQLLTAQEEVMAAKQKNADLEKYISQRDSYSLVEVSLGNFAYRSKKDEIRIDLGGEETFADPAHHICQPCLDVRGHKSVLTMSIVWGTQTYTCPECKNVVNGRHVGN